jgi:putative transcriptional regulator
MARREVLRGSKISTLFQILVEIAKNQPNIRQTEIAEKLGITPQAVSECVRRLVSEGYVSSSGPVSYEVTPQGIEWILKGAEELKGYCRFISEEVVTDISTWSAIADEDLKEGERVTLYLEGGLLYAGKGKKGQASGITISAAKKGEDVGVSNLSGLIDLEPGSVTICKVPRVKRGGTRNLDLEKLRREVKGKEYVGALGIEALVALRKIGRRPDVHFGVKEAAIEAAQHGLSTVVVGVDDEVPLLVERLEREEIHYEVRDLSKGKRYVRSLDSRKVSGDGSSQRAS